MMKFSVGYKKDIGGGRSPNGDYYRFDKDKGIFLIADGMGEQGHEASRIAVEHVFSKLEDKIGSSSNLREDVSKAFREAHKKVLSMRKEMQKETGRRINLGTTLDVVVSNGENILTGHIGDSRIGVLRKDGSYEVIARYGDSPAEYLERDNFNEEIARASIINSSELGHFVGMDGDFSIEIKEVPSKDVSKIAMYTDGLENLANTYIQKILAENNPKEAAEKLINDGKNIVSEGLIDFYAKMKNIPHREAERSLAGKDNMTALVIEVEDEEKKIPEKMRRFRGKTYDISEGENGLYESMLRSSIFMYESGLYKDAFALAVCAGKNNPHSLTWRIAGSAAMELGEHDVGRKYLHIAKKINPADGNVDNTLGVYELSRKNYGKALSLFKEAVRKDNLYAVLNIINFEEYVENPLDSKIKSELETVKQTWNVDEFRNLPFGLIKAAERSKRALLEHPYLLEGMTTESNLSDIMKNLDRLMCYSEDDVFRYFDKTFRMIEEIRDYDSSIDPKTSNGSNHQNRLMRIYRSLENGQDNKKA